MWIVVFILVPLLYNYRRKSQLFFPLGQKMDHNNRRIHYKLFQQLFLTYRSQIEDLQLQNTEKISKRCLQNTILNLA